MISTSKYQGIFISKPPLVLSALPLLTVVAEPQHARVNPVLLSPNLKLTKACIDFVAKIEIRSKENSEM